MSITRQSPHIFSRSAAAPWKARVAGQLGRACSRSPAACRRACRTGCSGRARPRAARAAALRALPPSASHRRGCSVIASSGQVVAHRPHCTQFFSMNLQLRPVGVVGQRALGAGADAAQAQRALGGVDQQAAERRAGAPAARSSSAAARRLREQVVERQVQRGALVGLHRERGRLRRRPGAARHAQRGVERGQVARIARLDQAQVLAREAEAGAGWPAPPPSARPAPRGTRAPLRRSAAPRPGWRRRRSPPATGRGRRSRCATAPPAARAPARRARALSVRAARPSSPISFAPAPSLCSSSAASWPPAAR